MWICSNVHPSGRNATKSWLYKFLFIISFIGSRWTGKSVHIGSLFSSLGISWGYFLNHIFSYFYDKTRYYIHQHNTHYIVFIVYWVKTQAGTDSQRDRNIFSYTSIGLHHIIYGTQIFNDNIIIGFINSKIHNTFNLSFCCCLWTLHAFHALPLLSRLLSNSDDQGRKHSK